MLSQPPSAPAVVLGCWGDLRAVLELPLLLPSAGNSDGLGSCPSASEPRPPDGPALSQPGPEWA